MSALGGKADNGGTKRTQSGQRPASQGYDYDVEPGCGRNDAAINPLKPQQRIP
jgi:hypothetical protein